MTKKKLEELKILRKIYPETQYEINKESENPDFILSDSKNNLFGVEITKYFDTPISGRFKSIPNYVENIISNKFIHKKDIGILEVKEIVKVDENDRVISSPDKGVLRKLPQSIERINALKELVAIKNRKYYQQYNKDLITDLLIFDSGDLIAGVEIQKKQILNYLYKQEKANTLVSPFRSIILLIEEPTKQMIKIMLKSG